MQRRTYSHNPYIKKIDIISTDKNILIGNCGICKNQCTYNSKKCICGKNENVIVQCSTCNKSFLYKCCYNIN